MEKTRILFVIDSLKIGGAEVLLRDLANRLLDFNYQVFVSYSTPGPMIPEFKALEIPLFHLPRAARVDPLLLWKICNVIHHVRPHILHTHLFKSDFHGRLAGRLCRVPVVISTLHNQDVWARNRLLGCIYGTTARFADHLIAVSDEVRNFHIVNTNVPAKKITTILNGIDVDKFTQNLQAGLALRCELGIRREAPLVGIVGRLLPQKDHQNFLRAAKRIHRSLPDARFLVVGDGLLREILESQIRDLGIDRSVIFCGIRRDIPAVMAAIDLLVFSSLWEGLPVALLEGMAASRPVVATAVGGVPSVVEDGKTGILVPAGDSGILADACLQVLTNPSLAKKMGQAGRQRVENRYSIKSMISRTMTLYDDLFANARSNKRVL